MKFLKNKWQENTFNKILISSIIGFIVLSILIVLWACIVSIFYSLIIFHTINAHTYKISFFTNTVLVISIFLSIIMILCFSGLYAYFSFESWDFNKSKQKKERKNQILEFSKIGIQNLINLNKKVGLVRSKLNQHTLLIGATGSGKTTTALSIINQLVYKLNQTVIIIDGKGDIDLINKIKSIDKNAFIWTIGGKDEYNPFASKSHIVLADKIMSLFDFSEPHYQAMAHNYLLILIETLMTKKIKINLSNIIKHFPSTELKQLIDKTNPKYIFVTECKQAEVNGLLNRLSVYAEQLNNSVGLKNDLTKISKNHKVILFSLNSLDYPRLASNMGKLLIQDLKEFASIKPRSKHINLVLDEFNVFASDSIINLINKTRSFNYQCFLCFQTINDLKTDNRDLTDTIFGNTANIIAHNVKDPNSAEYLAKVFGTKTSQKITKQYDNKSKSNSKGSIREVEEYIVHPNDLKKLKVGQAYCKVLLPSSNQYIEKIDIENYVSE
ncbi:type IV secretion system DNA-binding domain-containing protein [Spiroplasma sp. AdecLV25b]|uniref:type IV secretory system conjugative DNA transfer family protein n=1 Tax=Spiroplasma sp. AdecLV25b TaxID=3027162 RepID=UPI0027E14AA3|nr:type IV secretion system DNA-binding domain-containing protein [Spiroplasma sp. AdecLV25b]